jgi:hypothetical protein
MAITVKHLKVSTIPDEADTSLVRPSDWNADHVLTGTIPIVNGGTGQTTANLAFNALAPSQTGNTGKYLTTDGTDTSWATNPLGTVTSVAASGGTGISVSGSPITTSGTLTITNTAPDQTVAIASGTGISVTGTYPSFTVTNTSPSSGGTVTSITAGTGLTGGTITTSGTIAIDSTVATLTGTQTLTNKTLTTPIIEQINDANGNAELKFSAIASAVNQVTIENSATGNPVHISATGTDTNIGIHLAPKGTSGYVNVQGGLDDTKRLMFNPNGATTNTRTMISSVQTVDRTITLPDATDTLVGKATTDTLTNKSISGSTNTLTNIANASLTNSAITINGTSTSLGGSISVGTVTSVTGTSPVVSSGGNTPAISMPAATTSVNGYLTSTDWTTFNNKGSGSVTSVALTAPSIFTVTGSPVTSTGTLALTYSGTALPILNGGTGQTTANAAFNALSPMTTIGDIIYGGASGVATSLAGNITTTAKFYTSTGTGTVAQAPILTTSTGTGSVVLATSPTLSGITVTGDISLNGSSTSQITIGISQTTTGNIDIGSLNGTGRLTLGYTTKTATTSIQGGATTTGLTKTINMGTGGLAGSTTTITIGSTAGTSTTTNNGTFTAIGGIAGGTF